MPLALAVAAVLAVLLMLAVAMPVTLTMVLGAGVVFKRRGTPQYWFAGKTHRRRRDRIAFLYGESVTARNKVREAVTHAAEKGECLAFLEWTKNGILEATKPTSKLHMGLTC
jgi:hypothetical protein